jgi:predicted nucleotide-binding protein
MIDRDVANSMIERLFLHFFDLHFLDAKGADAIRGYVTDECRLATRFSLLAAKEVLVPAASYFESPVCRTIVDEFESVFDTGIIWLVGGGSSSEEFRYEKLQQYPSGSSIRSRYSSRRRNGSLPPFRTRKRSSTRDIVKSWSQHLETSQIETLFSGTPSGVPTDLERRWASVPDRLANRAFIVDHVMPIVVDHPSDRIVKNRLHSVVNYAYFNSYVGELDAGVVTDLIYLAAPHEIPSLGIDLSFRSLLAACRYHGVLEDIATAAGHNFLQIRQDERWIKALFASEHKIETTNERKAAHRGEGATMTNLRSFIVHGHDRQALFELKDYLQNTLGMPEPIVLEQQPNLGRTIIEEFEEYANAVDIALVLLTPDDLGGTETDLRGRARQNVVFELGYFVARFGRRSGRTILLHKGALEIPSDLAGVVYVDISAGPQAAGEKIRKELSAVK